MGLLSVNICMYIEVRSFGRHEYGEASRLHVLRCSDWFKF